MYASWQSMSFSHSSPRGAIKRMSRSLPTFADVDTADNPLPLADTSPATVARSCRPVARSCRPMARSCHLPAPSHCVCGTKRPCSCLDQWILSGYRRGFGVEALQRVMCLLAIALETTPAPSWSTPHRPGCSFTLRQLAQSLLEFPPRANLTGRLDPHSFESEDEK